MRRVDPSHRNGHPETSAGGPIAALDEERPAELLQSDQLAAVLTDTPLLPGETHVLG